GDPVTIRVLDWSADKDIEALGAAGVVPDVVDLNPAFGLRGIRLLLRHPELLETQLAAILRAATAGPVRILLQMVTTAGEVGAAAHPVCHRGRAAPAQAGVDLRRDGR